MKYLQRYCLLLCALVMCVGLFSTTAHAKAVDIPAFTIDQYFTVSHGSTYYLESFSFTPRNSTEETRSFYTFKLTQSNSTAVNMNNTFDFRPIENDVFFKCGGKVSLTIKNTQIRYLYCIGDEVCTQYYIPDTYRLLLFYTDGTTEYIDNVEIDKRNYYVEFTPKKDVSHFELVTTIRIVPDNGVSFQMGVTFGECIYGDTGYELIIEEENEEVGLLKGIIGWLQGIKDGITNLFNSIAELPTKLWDKISEGLKSLFVPSENDMVAYKDKWDELLSSRFGAVYEVGNIMTDSWDSVMNADQTNSIEFPSATINLPGGNEFTFGGYTVQVVPNGFSAIIVAVKAIVAIVCTVAFVNGMRKRYDEIMGVEQ